MEFGRFFHKANSHLFSDPAVTGMSEGRSLGRHQSFVKSRYTGLTDASRMDQLTRLVSGNKHSMQEQLEFFIHPSVDLSPSSKIGAGTRIWNHAQVREYARIGSGCILGKDVYVDFEVQIGDNVKIQNGAMIYHGTTIESGVFIGPGVIFTNDKIPRAINPDGSLKGDDDWEVGQTRVRFGASIGAGAIILPGLTIGRYALIGAGAIVTRNVSDHALVLGNPARQVGYVCKCATILAETVPDVFQCPKCGEDYYFREDGDHDTDL